MLTRRSLVAASAAMPFAGAAMAQDYPRRPIQMIVAFPAGGGTDVGARVLASIAEKAMGQAILVVNKTGAGAKALRDYYQLLVNENVSPVITPDGPTGPPHRFKPGGLLLAQISGRPLLPMAFAASSAWHFGWDDFVLPRPGSRIAIAIGAPVKVDRSVALSQGEVLEQWQQRLERELASLSQAAQAALA